jgi:hypothetical protein
MIRILVTLLFLPLFLEGQTITHIYHLNDSMFVDSIETKASEGNQNIFYLKQQVKYEDAQDLTEYHYFLALLAFYNNKQNK